MQVKKNTFKLKFKKENSKLKKGNLYQNMKKTHTINWDISTKVHCIVQSISLGETLTEIKVDSTHSITVLVEK